MISINFLLYYIRLLGNIMRSYGSLMPVFTMKFVLAPCFTSAQLISVGGEFKPYNISDNIIIYIAKPLNKAAGIIINISRF